MITLNTLKLLRKYYYTITVIRGFERTQKVRCQDLVRWVGGSLSHLYADVVDHI